MRSRRKVYQRKFFSDGNDLHIDPMRIEGRLSKVHSVLACTSLSGSNVKLESSKFNLLASSVAPETECIPGSKSCSEVPETIRTVAVE